MRFNRVHDWLDWQQKLHPDTIDLGLERSAEVWSRLQQSLDSVVISIAGTNGKGSCGAMLESVYTEAGYRVGSYSSPHLLSYNERIRIHACNIDDETLCQAFAAVDEARGDVSLSYFEFGTLAALYCFSQANLDVVILEVGLGGRLDAVNIIDADVALITSIDLDHQQWLGDDRESIGYEKAGIFRAQQRAVFAESDPPASVLDHAARLDTRLFVYQRDYHVHRMTDSWTWRGPAGKSRYGLPHPGLRGDKQIQNAAAVVMVTELLSEDLAITQAQLKDGLRHVQLAGRFQIIPGQPAVILDVAHNPHAIAALVENLRAYQCRGRVRAVFSMLNDKDLGAVIRLLKPWIGGWYIAPLDDPRACTNAQLEQALSDESVDMINVHATIREAFQAARSDSLDADCILVCGSFFTVAEVMSQG